MIRDPGHSSKNVRDAAWTALTIAAFLALIAVLALGVT